MLRERKSRAALLGAAGLFMALTACGGGPKSEVRGAESVPAIQTQDPGSTDAALSAAHLATPAAEPTPAPTSLAADPAAEASPAETPIPVPSPVTVKLQAPIVIAEGVADADGDGKGDTVRIWFTEGKEVTDFNPGPFEGTFRYGHFDAVLTGADGKERGRLSLSTAFGQDMSFRQEPVFPLAFDDYNGDGQPDFSIGQWSGSNGGDYALFSVEKDGFRIIERDIYSADHRPSIRYRKVGAASFLNIYYDMIKGQYMEVRRDWEKGSFTRQPAKVTTIIGSAGLD